MSSAASWYSRASLTPVSSSLCQLDCCQPVCLGCWVTLPKCNRSFAIASAPRGSLGAPTRLSGISARASICSICRHHGGTRGRAQCKWSQAVLEAFACLVPGLGFSSQGKMPSMSLARAGEPHTPGQASDPGRGRCPQSAAGRCPSGGCLQARHGSLLTTDHAPHDQALHDCHVQPVPFHSCTKHTDAAQRRKCVSTGR